MPAAALAPYPPTTAAPRRVRRRSPIDRLNISMEPEDPPPVDGQVTWSVSVYRKSGDDEVHEYTSHRLTSPDLVREHVNLALERPWVARVALTEHVREVTRRVITEFDLPGEGRPSPVPPNPPHGRTAARFYEIEGLQGGGLLSVDDVRWHLERLRGDAERQGGAAGPVGMALRELTVVDYSRPTTEDRLPHTSHDA
ncbi:hypothetical protein ACIPJK_00885 [Streptomyces roseus]|uniref:hypothetical protein n=1 Tax=Streptomyces TaxID=1883 RepID=UPI00100E2A6A|nr:hypothetical protein [Streptomyces sp. M3]